MARSRFRPGERYKVKNPRRGKSPAEMAIVREALAAKRAGPITAPPAPDIVAFVTRDLGLQPSPAQLALLKSFYGLPLDDAEMNIWTESTGRASYPGKPFVELTLVSGARSGKNAYVLTPVLLFEAIHGGFKVNPGETVVVPCVAQDATAADVSMRLVKEYARRLGDAVVDETQRRLALRNGVEFRIFPCTSKSLYGVSICGAGLDEVGRFKFSGADTDEDIEAGALRGMGAFGNRAKLIKVSTPMGKVGVLWRDFERSWGRDDDSRLVWRSSSAAMAPMVNSPEFLQRMRETLDPVRYARLFDAEFSETADVFLGVDVIERATDRGVLERRPGDCPPGTRFTAFCDPAGHGGDLMTLAVVASVGDGANRGFVLATLHVARKAGENVTENMVRSCADVLRRFGLSRVWGDRMTGGWVLDAFRRYGIQFEYPHLRRDERGVDREKDRKQVYASRSLIYLEFSPIVRSGAVRLLDLPDLRREFTNLEQTGDRVEPGPMHDDRAIAVAGAVVVAAQGGSGPRPWVVPRGIKMLGARSPLAGCGPWGSPGSKSDYAAGQVRRALGGFGSPAGRP